MIAEERIENQTDGDVPNSREDERRNCFDTDADEEISGTPEDIHRGKCNQHHAARSDDRAWDHVEMRDNRSEVFRMELESGSHRFSYTARATTPGTFLAAPAKAEEMYSPETFGRSTGATVVVQ